MPENSVENLLKEEHYDFSASQDRCDLSGFNRSLRYLHPYFELWTGWFSPNTHHISNYFQWFLPQIARHLSAEFWPICTFSKYSSQMQQKCSLNLYFFGKKALSWGITINKCYRNIVVWQAEFHVYLIFFLLKSCMIWCSTGVGAYTHTGIVRLL